MEVCPICLENIDLEASDFQTLACSHNICIDCVYRLIIHGQFKTCPLRRAKINISVAFASGEDLVSRVTVPGQPTTPIANIIRNIQRSRSTTTILPTTPSGSEFATTTREGDNDNDDNDSDNNDSDDNDSDDNDNDDNGVTATTMLSKNNIVQPSLLICVEI